MMLARAKLYALFAPIVLGVVVFQLVAWRWHLIDHERNRAAAEAARDFKTTIERIEDADVSTGDADDDLRWLADRLRQVGGR